MKRNLLAVLLFAAAIPAMASDKGDEGHPSNNAVYSTSNSGALAFGGSGVGYGGYATSGPSSSNASQSTVVSTRYEDFPVNTAIANPAHTTAPCRAGVGVGAQGRFFGFSIGGSAEDKECEARMWAETWQAMGQPQAAVEAACKSEMNKGLTICQPK